MLHFFHPSSSATLQAPTFWGITPRTNSVRRGNSRSWWGEGAQGMLGSPPTDAISTEAAIARCQGRTDVGVYEGERSFHARADQGGAALTRNCLRMVPALPIVLFDRLVGFGLFKNGCVRGRRRAADLPEAWTFVPALREFVSLAPSPLRGPCRRWSRMGCVQRNSPSGLSAGQLTIRRAASSSRVHH